MANRFGSRILFILVSTIIITGFLVFLFFYIKHQFSVSRIEISDSGLVQKITSMGKLELVKYEMKDIIEQKEVHPILPDSRVLLLAVGEVTACIDLTKVKRSDIIQGKDSVTVFLPAPEICYAKLDHEKSKVYDIKGVMFEDGAKDLVEDVYKLAEKKILDDANEMNVLGMARQNAQVIFKPLLEGISGKTVILKFR
ncbi:MAG TPA: DUF4230 domain-containing protein [Mucilaginibacter sp.]|jgi:hypothetical protein|nr:DUF4230 domain-containing protein [Mucilaginibacter sp.]